MTARCGAVLFALVFWAPTMSVASTDTATVAPSSMPRAPIPQERLSRPFDAAPMPEGGVQNPLLAPARGSPTDLPPIGPTPAAITSNLDGGRRFGDYANGPSAPVDLDFSWNGYLRLIVEAVENDARSAFVGRNDGFKVANARVGLRIARGNFIAYLSADSAVGQQETFNDPDQDFVIRPRDLLIRYRLADFASMTVGRFKTPYDLGQLETTPYRLFIDQPVASRGVLPTQGLPIDGIGQGRQLGAMIHCTRLGLDLAGFDVGYALAITNGRTLEFALNDNDRVAGFGRLSLYWKRAIQLNVAGFYDNRTVGDVPAVFDEDVRGIEVSTVIGIDDFNIEGQLLYQSTEGSGPAIESWGAHGQIAYTVGRGFQLAYRFSYYDPINVDDAVSEHTAGVSYSTPHLPLRFVLNGTLVLEQSNVRVDNNRLAFLTQFVF
ncbi:MAG: hypothetical protein AAF449_06980 [Myxococcota bacterium]